MSIKHKLSLVSIKNFLKSWQRSTGLSDCGPSSVDHNIQAYAAPHFSRAKLAELSKNRQEFLEILDEKLEKCQRIDDCRKLLVSVTRICMENGWHEEIVDRYVGVEKTAWNKGNFFIKHYVYNLAQDLLRKKRPDLARSVVGPDIPLNERTAKELHLLSRIAIQLGDMDKGNYIKQYALMRTDSPLDMADFLKLDFELELGVGRSRSAAQLQRAADGFRFEGEAAKMLFGSAGVHAPFLIHEIEDCFR